MDQGPIDPDTELSFLLRFSIKLGIFVRQKVLDFLENINTIRFYKGVLLYRLGKTYVENDLHFSDLCV